MKQYDGVIFDWRNTLIHDVTGTLFPDTLPTLTRLHQTCTFAGVVSDRRAAPTHAEMRRLRFPLHRMSFIQTIEHMPDGYHYTDPVDLTPAIGALESIGLRRDRMVYIGDHVDDLTAAHAVDVDFIGVTTGTTTVEEFVMAGARLVVASLNEVQPYL